MQIPTRLLVFNIRKSLVTVLPWRWEQCSNTLTTGFDTLQTPCLLQLCVSGCSLSQPTTQNFPHHTHRKSSRTTQQVLSHSLILLLFEFSSGLYKVQKSSNDLTQAQSSKFLSLLPQHRMREGRGEL